MLKARLSETNINHVKLVLDYTRGKKEDLESRLFSLKLQNIEDKARLPILIKYRKAKIALQTALDVGGGSRENKREKRNRRSEAENSEDDIISCLNRAKKQCLSGSYGQQVAEGDR